MRFIDADELRKADFQDFSNTDVINAIDEAPNKRNYLGGTNNANK